jgi:hypothetical protein
MPLVAPVVADAGRIWALFADTTGFVVNEFGEAGQTVVARGTCPDGMQPVVLGVVAHVPAVLCADLEQARIAYGVAHQPLTSASLHWRPTLQLPVSKTERLRDVSHFAWLDGRLAILYRSDDCPSRDACSVMPTANEASGIDASTTESTRKGRWWLYVDGSSVAPSLLCSPEARACVGRPVTLFTASGQFHAVIASAKSSESYVHLAHRPGKALTSMPVEAVPSVGKPLSTTCISAKGDGSLRVFTPHRSLVGALEGWQGERVGILEGRGADVPQGPDVLSNADTRCPPEVRAQERFALTSAERPVDVQWVRASRNGDTWVVGYAVKPFTARQGETTYSYPESFWVLRRHGRN